MNFFKFDMSGQELCDLGKEGFLDLAPDFVGDILWEHLEQMLIGKQRPSLLSGRVVFESSCTGRTDLTCPFVFLLQPVRREVR